MKKILSILTFMGIILAGIVSGCSEKVTPEDPQQEPDQPIDTIVVASTAGSVRLTVSVSEHGYTTKSSEGDISAFILTFTGIDDPSFVREFTVSDFNSEYPDGIMELEPGEYNVTVVSPETEDVAWEQPVYYDSATFSIETDITTSVDLVGSIQNMKVTVSVTDDFKAMFGSYSIVVAGVYDGDSKYLTWTNDEVEDGAAGYFAVSDLTITTTATFEDGSEYSDEQTITGVSAADWYDILIEAPEIEEPDTTPDIVWEANPDFKTVALTDDLNLDFLIKAPEGIEGFIVTISSTSFMIKLGLSAMGLSGNLDLVNDASVISIFQQYGLPCGDELYGKTEVTMSFTKFIAKIKSYGVGSGSTNTFKMTVTDSIGQSVTKTAVITM